MNASSSRSHAIFTVTLVQTIVKTYNEETITKKLESKFHFVDLAGSERVCTKYLVWFHINTSNSLKRQMQ
jgi:hypothetical protein